MTIAAPARPLAEGLVTDEPQPRLIGGRHRADGRIVFPMPQGGEGSDYEPIALSPTGTLWSWTVQRFRPKTPPYVGPDAFEPYAVGYVELPGQVIVESRLTGIAFDALEVGMHLRLTIVPFMIDAHGATVTTFAFRPDEATEGLA